MTSHPELSPHEYSELLQAAREHGPVKGHWDWWCAIASMLTWAGSLSLIATGNWFAMISAGVLLGFSLLLQQLLLHECAHATLFRSTRLNQLVGFFLGLNTLTPFGSYQRGHAAHHTLIGTDGDPTAAPRTAARRAKLIEFIVKLRIFPVLYLGGVYAPYLLFDFRRGSSAPLQQRLSTLTQLIAIVTWHLALAYLLGFLAYGVVSLASFWIAGLLYEYLFTQNQHVGLLPVPDDQSRYSFRDQVNFSRSVSLPFAGWFLYFNLHKEHHLFPQLSFRYLPVVHRWLKDHRSDILEFTSDDLGPLRRRRHLNLFTPTSGDHD